MSITSAEKEWLRKMGDSKPVKDDKSHNEEKALRM